MTTSLLHLGKRLPAFAIAATALLATPCLNHAQAEGETAATATPANTANTALLETAKKNLPKLQAELLATLEQSRKNDPQQYKTIVVAAGDRALNSINHSLKPVDMSNVRGAPYATYNKDIWRFRSVAGDVHALALAYNSSDSPLAGKPEVAAKAAEAFEWALTVVTPKGTCDAPDSNIDRFAFVQNWDAFVLMSPTLPEDLKERFLNYLLTAADFQLSTYATRAYPMCGGYPNMDAAFTLVMEQAYRLFEKPEYNAQVDRMIAMLQQCIHESTWDYIIGWNPQANYTQVTLAFVGRLYQLSGKETALKQIKQHVTYYTYHLEPNGLIEYVQTPFIKHDWNQTPYGMAASPLELVNRYAPSPVLRGEIAKMRETGHSTSDHLALYWLSDISGEKAPQPTDFVRQTADFDGFQARVTRDGNTLSAYGTGKKIAVDARVGAMVSSKSGKDDAGLAGVFIELFQNGMSYYVGDMKPEVDLKADAKSATLTVTQARHAMGPKSRPLILGNHLEDIKNWKYGCWEGGSPTTPPVQTKEQWTWANGRLTGDITATAQAQTTLDGIKISFPVIQNSLTESKQIPNGQAYRFGNLCFSFQSPDTQWKHPETKEIFDFRADVPPGKYTVTMASGAENAATDPFDVLANGKLVAEGVQAKQGAFAERSFTVDAKKGAILLRFVPRTGGNHWKLGALSITSADGKISKKFAVGQKDKAPAEGVLRIAGADLYTPERGYGWASDHTGGERHYNWVSGPAADFITSPGSEAKIVMECAKTAWEKGDATQAHIVIGMGNSLDSWLASGSPKTTKKK